MKCTDKWGFKPYVPYDRYEGHYNPYIVRLVPGESSVELQWIDNGSAGGAHEVFYAKEGIHTYDSIRSDGSSLKIGGLDKDCGYKIYVSDTNGRKSPERLFRTGFVPGIAVNYLHPRDRQYAFSGNHTCSPSVVKLPSGRLLVSMDIFDGGYPQNLTLVFYSDDGGQSWNYLTDIFPCFWGTLFIHKGILYHLGMSNEYGDLLIGRSDDGGSTWSAPTVIMRGSASTKEPGPHRAPVGIYRHNGRLWTAVEYGAWDKQRFASGVFSVGEDEDIMISGNWRCTGFLPHDKKWIGALNIPGAIEGNAVPAPDGGIRDILRYSDNKALVLDIDPDDPDKLPVFRKFIDCPFAHSKFEIKRHENGLYYALGNRLPLRTILSVFTSRDLENWEFLCDVENREEMPPAEVGFQYPAFIFDGNEILTAVRTAYNGAENFHDSNYITFYRIKI